jgi:type 2A phosphatase activator TIP41
MSTTMASTSETVYPSDDKLQPIKVETLSSPVPHTLTHTPSSHSIAIAGWTITATKLPISSSADGDELTARLGIPVPEMTFGNNSVHIAGPGGWECEFNTIEALDGVDKTGSKGMKVSFSEEWNRTRYGLLEEDVDGRARDSEDIKGIVKPYDWTYTTPYRGTFNQPVHPESNYVY